MLMLFQAFYPSTVEAYVSMGKEGDSPGDRYPRYVSRHLFYAREPLQGSLLASHSMGPG